MQRRTIGAVAREAGVNVETVRYYERRGLLAQPETPREGWREYDAEAVATIQFIKRAQELGFTLNETRELLALRQADAGACDEVRAAAEEKLHGVERKIRDLQRVRRALRSLVSACEREGAELHCPILESLSGPNKGEGT